MNLRITTIILASTILLAGCATSSPILPAKESTSGFEGAVYPGQETKIADTPPGVIEYRIFHQGATGFVSVQSVREDVEKRAIDYCSEHGKHMLRLREHTSTPPHITGNFPRVELIFGCVTPG